MDTTSIRDTYGPWALIAGGSEGIGYAFAEQLAASGINLLLLARTSSTLEAAAERLREQHDVEVRSHTLDLTSDDLDTLLSSVCGDLEIGLMIYNAGATHGAALFDEAPLATAQNLIKLNCTGPVTLCHRLIPGMLARGRGGIILLSSMSGLAGGAYVAAYAATKSFDITLAESLWAELNPRGVHVLGLIAGATDTPAMARSGIDFDREGGMPPMTSEDVAFEGLSYLAKGPVHVAGELNRSVCEFLRGERGQASEMMSHGAAAMYGLPYPPE